MNTPQDSTEGEQTNSSTDDAPATKKPSLDPELARILGEDPDSAAPLWVRHRQTLIYGGGALLVALALWMSLGGSGDNVVYVTEPANRIDLVATVTATGAIEPTNQVDVSSELSGTVREVLADYNSTVSKGQVLAELDTDKLEASVDSARAKLLAARARVKEAEATVFEAKLEFDRKSQLVARRIASDQERDSAKAAHLRAQAALESAKADVVAAQADLKLSETNLGKACICSPIDGVVLSRDVERGQTVAASLSAPILFTLAEDLTSMELQVDVDEADVGRVREGQRARFSVDAYSGQTFSATISELRYGSEVVNGVVTYKAVLTTQNADMLLRPGMTATADIVVDEVMDALTIPNAALRFAPPQEEQADQRSFLSRLMPGPPQRRVSSRKSQEGPERTIWALVDGEPQAVSVTIGATDGARTAILEGAIEAGTAVIVDSESRKE